MKSMSTRRFTPFRTDPVFCIHPEANSDVPNCLTMQFLWNSSQFLRTCNSRRITDNFQFLKKQILSRHLMNPVRTRVFRRITAKNAFGIFQNFDRKCSTLSSVGTKFTTINDIECCMR